MACVKLRRAGGRQILGERKFGAGLTFDALGDVGQQTDILGNRLQEPWRGMFWRI